MTIHLPQQTTTLSITHLWMIVATRLIVNSAFRIVYPLLPFLALRLDVDDATVNLLVTVQVVSGLISLSGGMIADRIGDRLTMALGLAIFAAGSGVCALAGTFLPFFFGYAVIGAGTAIYVPAAQSYVSHHTPYSRRGRALGTVELGWALAGIITVPLLSRLVAAQDDWTLAFVGLGGGGLAALSATLVLLPQGAQGKLEEGGAVPLRDLLRRRRVVGMAGALFLTLAGIELVFIVQSLWQERFLGLDTAGRGDLFGMIGFAELVGALSVALLVDRLGIRRAAIGAYAIAALIYLLLPLTVNHLLFYGIVFLLLGLCFEFALVASFPLLSELAPDARGTTIAFGTAALASGRALGSALGEPIWSSGGRWANGAIACVLTLLGVLLLVRYVREAGAE